MRTAISAGTFLGNFFFAGLPKIVEVHTTTGRRGKLWPADAGPEGGDYLSSCELEQFLEAQRKKTHQNQSPKMEVKLEIKMKKVLFLATQTEQFRLIFWIHILKKYVNSSF